MAGKKKVARRKPGAPTVPVERTQEIVIGHVTKRCYYDGRIIDPDEHKTIRVICPVENGKTKVPSWLAPVKRESVKDLDESLFDDGE